MHTYRKSKNAMEFPMENKMKNKHQPKDAVPCKMVDSKQDELQCKPNEMNGSGKRGVKTNNFIKIGLKVLCGTFWMVLKWDISLLSIAILKFSIILHYRKMNVMLGIVTSNALFNIYPTSTQNAII